MAAAYAALVSLYNNIQLIGGHPRHSFSFEPKQLHSLWESVCLLIVFMTNCYNSHGTTKEGAEALESRIARAVQAAEDVIESHVVDQIHGGSTLGGNKRPRFLLDLQKAIQDVDFVRRKAFNILQSQSGFNAEQPITSAAATASSTPMASEKNMMIGFDDKLLRLLDLLTGEPSSRLAIPIVGMGGIGKTTLATNAFQNKLIVDHFDLCLWATLSQEFSVHKILTELIASLPSKIKEETCFLSKTSTGESSVTDLGLVLHKSLFGRRYLIILDDMWSAEAWDELQYHFPDTSNGSRIVVTTRDSNVAHHFDSWCIHMPLLDKDNGWDLFCNKTFDDQMCPPQLEDVGKKIVEKCRGLPLAIVVVGGHLRKSPRMIEYWEYIVNDMSSVLNSGENEQCLNILSLSYRHLPVQLKPCFLFFGVFREDKDIQVSELLNLWIAEGFIGDFLGSCSMEDVAYSYLCDLYERNLISIYEMLVGVKNYEFCRIHDLVREMCLNMANEEELFSVFDTRRAINGGRRVVIKGKISKENHEMKLFDAQRSPLCIRSLICEGGQLSFDLKLLRILNKVDSNQINSQQVNLRYVNINSDTCYIPSSISLLWNLQTLIITGASGPIIAPYEIWEMLQLRHIEVDPICLPDPPRPRILGQENTLVMKNLHTLCQVRNFRLIEEVCRRIPNVKRLEVSYCDEPGTYYRLHNLGSFKRLESLQCYFDPDAKWRDFALRLTFPSSLKQLRLRGCRLSWEELTMKVGFLPHLEILDLSEDAGSGSEWTPIEGGFPRLRKLFIVNHDLICWNADPYHFPILEFVSLSLPMLDEFPCGIGDIPTLKLITMVDCSMSSTLSAMGTVVEQEEQGNEWIQLHVFLEGDEVQEFKQKVEEEGLTSSNVYLNDEKLKM